MTVFALAAMISIMLVVVLLIGASSVATTKAKIDNDLDVAIEQSHLSGYTLELRNLDDPYTKLANDLLQSLRSSGFKGQVDVYTYECSEAEINAQRAGLAQNARLIVYQVNLTQPSAGLVAGAGVFDGIGVSAVKTSSITPYSGIRIYRPATASPTCRHYSAPAGKNSFAASDAATMSGLTKALDKCRSEALAKVVDALDE